MKGEIPELKTEEGGFGKNRNLIVGDPSSAKVIVGAHYDTCAELPFPNFITPKNIFIYILYNFALVLPMIVLVTLSNITLNPLFYFGGLIYFALLMGIMLLGRPNKHTANDNTSGVIALCELWAAMSDEDKAKTVLVFFDNEENGLLGSAFYRKKHKKEIKQQLMINLDCISDGDYIMLIKSPEANGKYGSIVASSFSAEGEKSILLENSAGTLYPSDQAGFPIHVAVAAMKKGKRVGYYLDRIHTKKDTQFDRLNIEIITKGIVSLISRV